RLLRFFHTDHPMADAALEALAGPALLPDDRAELALFDRLLSEMQGDLRIAWMLRRVEGFELTEIAAMCGCSLATVKRRIGRADADGRPVVAVTAAAEDLQVPLSDGSQIQLYPGASLVPLEASGTIFSAALQRGSAAFSVRPGGPRRWIIECGLATVEVIGTR